MFHFKLQRISKHKFCAHFFIELPSGSESRQTSLVYQQTRSIVIEVLTGSQASTTRSLLVVGSDSYKQVPYQRTNSHSKHKTKGGHPHWAAPWANK
jgi:hypothetical protein